MKIRTKTPVLLLCLLLVCNLSGCLGSLLGPKSDPHREDPTAMVSPEDEYYLGRAAAAGILETRSPLRVPKANEYASRIAQALVLFQPQAETYGGYSVVILDTDEPATYALPGGILFLSRGVLAYVSGESELAALLAHEIAHVQNRDALRSVSESNLRQAAAWASEPGAGKTPPEGLTAAFSGCVTEIVAFLTERSYTSEQEVAANRLAANILAQAGYSPQALDSLLAKLSGRPRAHPGEALAQAGTNTRSPEETPARARRFAAALGKYAASAP